MNCGSLRSVVGVLYLCARRETDTRCDRRGRRICCPHKAHFACRAVYPMCCLVVMLGRSLEWSRAPNEEDIARIPHQNLRITTANATVGLINAVSSVGRKAHSKTTSRHVGTDPSHYLSAPSSRRGIARVIIARRRCLFQGPTRRGRDFLVGRLNA